MHCCITKLLSCFHLRFLKFHQIRLLGENKVKIRIGLGRAWVCIYLDRFLSYPQVKRVSWLKRTTVFFSRDEFVWWNFETTTPQTWHFSAPGKCEEVGHIETGNLIEFHPWVNQVLQTASMPRFVVVGCFTDAEVDGHVWCGCGTFIRQRGFLAFGLLLGAAVVAGFLGHHLIDPSWTIIDVNNDFNMSCDAYLSNMQHV